MRTRVPNVLIPLILGAAACTLGGCSMLPSWSSISSVSGEKVMGLVTPYRVEIVQGNVLTKEQVERTKPGMTREQVRDILGSPLLTDIFHNDRWDYTFTIRRQGTPFEQRKVVAWFEGDTLKKLDVPDNLPTEREFIAAIAPKFGAGPARKLELTEAEVKALPLPPKPAEAAASDAAGPQRTYPPLESGE